jgi:hypothetical protein
MRIWNDNWLIYSLNLWMCLSLNFFALQLVFVNRLKKVEWDSSMVSVVLCIYSCRHFICLSMHAIFFFLVCFLLMGSPTLAATRGDMLDIFL